MRQKRNVPSEIKKIIRSNNSNNKRLIKNLRQVITNLENSTLSVPGLEELSESSIKTLQKKKHFQLQKFKRFSMQFTTGSKKSTALENKTLK